MSPQLAMLSLPADLHPMILQSPVELHTLRCTCKWFSITTDPFEYFCCPAKVTREVFRERYATKTIKSEFYEYSFSPGYFGTTSTVKIPELEFIVRTSKLDDIDKKIVAFTDGNRVFCAAGGYETTVKAHKIECRRAMKMFTGAAKMILQCHARSPAKFRPLDKRYAAEFSPYCRRQYSSNGVTIVVTNNGDRIMAKHDGVLSCYDSVARGGNVIVFINGYYQYFTGPYEGARHLRALFDVYLVK